jgi:phospholipase C
MPSKSFIAFEPSRRAAPLTATRTGDVPADEQIQVSVYLKPRDSEASAGAEPSVGDGPEPREALRHGRAARHADDIRLITDFANEQGLTVVSVEPGRRLVKLAGPAAKFEAAFRTQLGHFHDGKNRFRARSGALHMPEDVAAVVESVLGLDTRPAASPRLVRFNNAAALPGYLPNQVATLYGFPSGVTGAGQCIALIELGGGFTPSDTQAAFQAMGLTPPQVIAVSVDGGANKPTPDDGADGEVALDIQVAGGVAPGATIAVYFAPNTDAGFVDAVTAAAQDSTNKPSVISISWGSAESTWTAQALQSMTTALQDAASVNVTVFVAAGDNLATDGVTDGKAHVDFPASSPWAIGCGGTNITVANGAITAETVWNDGSSGTGGGISDVYPVPSFQQKAGLPVSVNDQHAGRGVPDVAGDAAPGTGYDIVVNGQMGVVGGTSAVAPLWAGLTALINQQAAKPVGFFLPTIYANPSLLRQITTGNNQPSGSNLGYSAGPGWNACTGLGVPQGQALFAALTQPASQPPSPPAPPSPPPPPPSPVASPSPTPSPAPPASPSPPASPTPPASPSPTPPPPASPSPTPSPQPTPVPPPPPPPNPAPNPSPAPSPAGLLSQIDHIVVLMLENRSFDHMLGFLYADHGNVSPSGQPFEGLTGNETNPDGNGGSVQVFKIDPTGQYAYFMPGADPGEGFNAANSELYGTTKPAAGAAPTNQGFVTDFTYTLGWEGKEKRSILPGTISSSIMGMFTPPMLPILSGLARGFAVCDHWFASVPTETMPNRAFACAATSQGYMDDKTKTYTAPSIFGALSKANIAWKIYGYSADPLTRQDFPDTTNAPETHFGLFTDFQNDARTGALPAYAFLEPSWDASGNSQHPNYDVSKGEQLIHDVYYALRNGPGWASTLLIVTYDEHGGCFDHVPPPSGATPPDNSAGEFGFDFTRFGVRVPTVLVSPLIAPGSVFRAPPGGPPFDHTSILKTVEKRWGLAALTARDAAAPDVGPVLTLAAPRTDDPIAGVTVPQSGVVAPNAHEVSHLQQIHAELAAALPVPDNDGGTHHLMPAFASNDECHAYIVSRTAAWKAARHG